MQQVVISLEGNISAGKSTLLQLLKQTFPEIQVIPEPLELWQSTVNSDNKNILELFYEDMTKYGYVFESFSLLSRVEQFEQIDKTVNCAILERSFMADKHIFTTQLVQDGIINEIEWIIYNKQYDQYQKNLLKPNQKLVFVYLKCPPEICFERLKQRGRVEENSVTLEYLEKLDKRHEEWLANEKNVIVVDASCDFKNDRKVLETIADQIFGPLRSSFVQLGDDFIPLLQ